MNDPNVGAQLIPTGPVPTIQEIAEEINRQSEGRPIGSLQQLRRELKGLNHVPTHSLFDNRTIFDTYAFHVGGRTELQFNIGIEPFEGQECLRHGVAFSLKLNRNLSAIDLLEPQIERFNEFIRTYPNEFFDFRMWHFPEKHTRSTNYAPAPIPRELVRSGVFIFFGRLQSSIRPNLDIILDDFDRLLPLYRFVEGDDIYPAIAEVDGVFHFLPGCRVKPSTTTASIAERRRDVQSRHNDLQVALWDYLASRHGQDSVRAEQATGAGTFIDVVARHGERYWFYEIKTSGSARGCIRDALAQLLEYSYWPRAQEAERLIIIGEPPLDAKARAFLDVLRERFKLPIYYQQFLMEDGKLIE